MEVLPNGMELNIPPGCFPLTTDSMVLAHFAAVRGKKAVLDLCAGCGTLGLLLCAAEQRCTVTGVELEPVAHQAALDNIHRNGLATRMKSICAGAAQVPDLFAAGSFDCCISNPPYFSGGPAAIMASARRDDCCPADTLMKSAAWALKYGGDFFLVHRPERLGELIALGASHRLEAKRLRLVRHREGGSVSLILLQFRRGAKPGLSIDEVALHHPDGRPTDAFREIYHILEE